MPIARVNGVSLYYEVAGRGAPLVLVHGFACGIRSWDPQVRALSRYRRVIAYDVRGHGLSDAPPEAAAYSQATSVADLHALLAHLKIGRAVVGGLSMGGNIALNFALAHPAMVSALIVADTGAGSEAAGDWAAGLRALGVPTLLIVGEYDTPCLKPHRFMADVMPKARHVVLRGVGHLTNLEAPAAFNAAVKSFLRPRAALRPGH